MASQINEEYTNFRAARTGIASWFGSWFYPVGRSGKFFAKFFSNREKPLQSIPLDSTQIPTEILPTELHPLAGDTIVRRETMGAAISPFSKDNTIVLTKAEMDRKRRYQEYEDMDDYPEICAAFDIYADDTTQENIDGTRWTIETDDDLAKSEVERLFGNLNLKRFIWDIVRNSVKYGDCFLELVVDINNISRGIQKIKVLDPNYIYRIENEYGYLTDFIQEIPMKDQWESLGSYGENLSNKVTIPLDKNQIVHFRLYTSDPTYYPYGRSIAASARNVYRSLKLMEDAMMVYRLSRAPERRIFYIDTGQLPANKAESFIEAQKRRFRKEKLYSRNGSNIDARHNPLSQDEDFFVAVNGKGSGTKIETLQGAQNLGEVDDVKYFRDKLLATLKIPKDYIVEKEQSPERKANLSQLDVKFARVIMRIQQCIEIGLETIAKRHLAIKGYAMGIITKLKIKLPSPSDMAAKRHLDIDEQKARVVQSIKTLNIFPLDKIYKDYYQLNDSEIEEIKDKLEEQSQDPVLAQITGMAPPMGAGAPGMEPPMGGGMPPGEAGGQEPQENIPPTAAVESVNLINLKRMALTEDVSPEIIKIINDLIIENDLNKNNDSEPPK